MLSSEQIKLAEQLSQNLDERQLAWLSGYFAGRQSVSPAVVAASPTLNETVHATVLYGSQTGNSKTVAEQLVKTLSERNINADMLSMHEYKTAKLKKEKFLFAVVSTHGEGDPPDTAAAFLTFLQSTRAPKLSGLSYSVLALGDSTYEHFCQTGRDLNSRLRSLGASPLVEFAECDVDFETTAGQWRAAVTAELARTAGTSSNISAVHDNAQIQTNQALYDRQTPFLAPVLLNIPLSNPERRTRHLELSLEDSGLNYQPGDSLGIWPHNNVQRAEQIASALKLDWESKMEIDGVQATVGEWLLAKLEIARLTPTVIARYCELAGVSPPPKEYANGRDLCDMISDFPPPEGVNPLACARRMTPRMYSLASSPTAREGEAHILVSRSSYYDAGGKVRDGVCSAYLGDLREGDAAKVFVQSNDNFRPPATKDAPLIMIGPGTGVAPFRAFIEDREGQNNSKTWLFFGERRRREDFYYQIEWQAALKSGALTRMDVAFSRDSAQKVYVQHKLRRRADEIWEWLQEGAHVYVCGDEKRMAKDVHAELCAIAESRGGDGEAYWAGMAESGRYKRDVY